MRNVSGKDVEKVTTHILYSITFPPYRAFCEKMWKNMVQLDRLQMTMWHFRVACWIPKGTNTHSEYVALIVFPLQKWLRERALMIPNAHIACLFEDNILF
jgi:hypothetical protein